jgi:adenine-specific DNA-methyltransferase
MVARDDRSKVIKEQASTQKLRGGYYTPEPIAQFLIEWALNGQQKEIKILEPSMGDGAFIIPTIRYMKQGGKSDSEVISSIFAAELFSNEIKLAKNTINKMGLPSEDFNFFDGDFFEALDSKFKGLKFDVILGNPPFIRYQNFPSVQRDRAMRQLNELGFKLNKLTNAWLFFLLRSISAMCDKSRLAMVIPAELLQVKYASSARQFLSEHCSSVTVITFKQLVFEGIQQEVVLLLAEKDSSKANVGIDAIELKSLQELSAYKHVVKNPDHLKPIDHLTDKWTQYFLDKDEILLLKSLENNKKLSRLGTLASVDVGIVTGNNNFFVMSSEQVKARALEKYTIPLVGKSASLKGTLFNDADWQGCNEKQLPSHLLALKPNLEKSEALEDYINMGVREGVNLGYKCRIRKEWYVVPSVRTSEAFLLRQVHNFPKLIMNEANAVCTDTIHRVTFFNPQHAPLVTASFINSLSFAISEVVGRSYGGGVLELEPSEAEDILIPFSEIASQTLDINYIDEKVKAGDIYAALDYVDKKLLIELLGFSKKEVLMLRNIWEKLSSRRINRK